MTTRAYQCSACKQTGHNKRTCPDLKKKKDVPPPRKVVDADACPICMEDLGETNCCTTPCGHKFCLECYVKHASTKSACPICRAVIPSIKKPRPRQSYATQRELVILEYYAARASVGNDAPAHQLAQLDRIRDRLDTQLGGNWAIGQGFEIP